MLVLLQTENSTCKFPRINTTADSGRLKARFTGASIERLYPKLLLTVVRSNFGYRRSIF